MTKVKITKKHGNIIKVEALGHTNYLDHGSDIVCAALSSIVQTAALGILQVVGLKAQLVKREKEGYLYLVLPKNLTIEQQLQANAILNTMLMGVSDLQKGYSDFIELEVLEDVY